MVHDDLLEQIRQPLLDRVDRRLAAILAISIGAHLTIAILGWLNEPPVKAWLDDPPQAAYTVETIDSINVPDPTPATAEPGTAAVVPAPKPAPAAVVPATAPGKSHHRGTSPPKAIDPRALVGDLVGHDPSFAAAGRRVGRDLDDQLAAAAQRDQNVHVGGDRDQEVERIGDDGGPDITGVDVTRTKKPREIEPPPPDVIIDEPTIPFDDDWLTTGARFHAVERCYMRSPEYLAHEPAKVHLTMTLGPTGAVIGAAATGPKGLAACIEARALTWKFPVATSVAVEVHTAYVFVSE